MDFSKNCTETNDYTIIGENEKYYICICNKCGEEFHKWK